MTKHNLSEQASLWLIKLHAADCSDAERQEFECWLNSEPEHAGAFRTALARWESFSQIASPPNSG